MSEKHYLSETIRHELWKTLLSWDPKPQSSGKEGFPHGVFLQNS
jgi:hypothetical protein